MKKLTSQLNFHPLAVAMLMALFLFFGNALQSTLAQIPQTQMAGSGTVAYPFQDTAQTQEDGTVITNLCEAEMKDFSSKELEDFRRFIDTNFQNKSSTFSLLDGAMSKYREMRAELYTAYGKYFPNQGSILLTAGLQPDKCKQIIDQTLSDAKILLKTHAMTTSGVKKSTALLEKYQQINAELAQLYQQFIYMRAYLDTFAGKIPCYAKSCVKG